MNAALVVAGLSVRAGAVNLIRDISFSIEPGRALTLLGESGAGKSLLAHALMGTLPAGLSATGRVRVGDQGSEAADAGARRGLWGRRIGLLPQEPWLALDPTMRVLDQVAETHRFVRGVRGLSAARARARGDLAAVGIDATAAAKYPHLISGGMAQRVAFAAVHAGGAPLLIADEPTKGLDARLRDEVVALLRGTLAEGGALLVITHDVAVARALGGRIAVMQDGEIVEQGEAAELLAAPRHPYTRALLDAEPARWPAPAPAGAGSLVVEGKGLAKDFGGHRLFAGVDLRVHAGERIAIRGPSGSGKTTLGNLLLGLVRPDEGRVERAAHVAPLGLQKLYQDPAAAFAPRVTLRGSLGDLVKRHRLAWPRLEALLARLRIDPALLERLPQQVSGGELQRIALARVLMLEPALIFADEPTSRLDPVTQRETMSLLLDSAAERGCALVLVTHDPDLADKVATRSLAIA